MSVADELSELEKSLLDPMIRTDVERVSLLLATGFKEFGKSGKVYSKEQIIALLSTEECFTAISIKDFRLELETESVALVTYRSVREGESALRSSVWVRQGSGWQMLFHQGTSLPGDQ